MPGSNGKTLSFFGIIKNAATNIFGIVSLRVFAMISLGIMPRRETAVLGAVPMQKASDAFYRIPFHKARMNLPSHAAA